MTESASPAHSGRPRPKPVDWTPTLTNAVAFDRDLAPGRSLSTTLQLPAPLREGAHDLCIDLVQQQRDRWVGLGAAPVRQRVELVRPPGLLSLHELIDAYRLGGREPEPCPAALDPEPTGE